MFLMFGDEADRDAVEGKKFFVYGAIFVPTNSIAALHAEVERLRVKAGMSSTDSLKSATTIRPRCLTADSHSALKQDVMKAAKEKRNVFFCAQVTLHELARKQ